jgi:hypothetical protein
MDSEQKTQTIVKEKVTVIQYKSGKLSVGTTKMGVMDFFNEKELFDFLKRHEFIFTIRDATNNEENID